MKTQVKSNKKSKPSITDRLNDLYDRIEKLEYRIVDLENNKFKK